MIFGVVLWDPLCKRLDISSMSPHCTLWSCGVGSFEVRSLGTGSLCQGARYAGPGWGLAANSLQWRAYTSSPVHPRQTESHSVVLRQHIMATSTFQPFWFYCACWVLEWCGRQMLARTSNFERVTPAPSCILGTSSLNATTTTTTESLKRLNRSILGLFEQLLNGAIHF